MGSSGAVGTAVVGQSVDDTEEASYAVADPVLGDGERLPDLNASASEDSACNERNR
jgi:hypothetical protein